jgi:hypothetical protein
LASGIAGTKELPYIRKGFIEAVRQGLAALDPAFEPEFAGMIWMQGESDASNKQMTAD